MHTFAANSPLRDWLQSQSPTTWSLLNIKAQGALPSGIVEYLSVGDPAEIDAGRAALIAGEGHLRDLITFCGQAPVMAAYRRDLSGVHTANQLAELLCEITLCASLARLSPQKPRLRPPSGRGTYCDVAVQLAGHDVYCEAKRYEDPWPGIEGPASRSIVKSAPDEKPKEAMRPRHMDLQSKLERVPEQFPQGTLNILFVFHRSVAESAKYVQQSLFGGSTFSVEPSEVRLQEDGLFATDAWRTVSACYLCRVQSDGNLVCPTTWQNPDPLVRLPVGVQGVLDRLRLHTMCKGNGARGDKDLGN